LRAVGFVGARFLQRGQLRGHCLRAVDEFLGSGGQVFLVRQFLDGVLSFGHRLGKCLGDILEFGDLAKDVVDVLLSLGLLLGHLGMLGQSPVLLGGGGNEGGFRGVPGLDGLVVFFLGRFGGGCERIGMGLQLGQRRRDLSGV